MNKHTPYKCPQPCDRPHCQFCEGGLLDCITCGGAEAELPSECPGVKMSSFERQAVMDRKIDFKNGEWIPKLTIEEAARHLHGQSWREPWFVYVGHEKGVDNPAIVFGVTDVESARKTVPGAGWLGWPVRMAQRERPVTGPAH